MYVFVQGNFTDAAHALHGVEDCLSRGLSKENIKVFISAAGDAKLSATEPPVVEEPAEEAPKGKKKDEGPTFDPAGYLYWAKLKKTVDVTIVEGDAIDSLPDIPEVKLALKGSKTLIEKGNAVVIVNQPSQPLDEKFD